MRRAHPVSFSLAIARSVLPGNRSRHHGLGFRSAGLPATSEEFLGWSKKSGGQIVATHLAFRRYRTIDYAKKPTILLMGNEQSGLPEELAKPLTGWRAFRRQDVPIAQSGVRNCRDAL